MGNEDRSMVKWDKRGVFLARKRDFYICHAYKVGPVYKARFGHLPLDWVGASSESLEQWDMRQWVIRAATDGTDPLVPLKALYMLHRDGALGRGFAVYKHPLDRPEAYVLTSPTLGPAEHQILGEGMDTIQDLCRDGHFRADLVRLADALARELEKLSNTKGAVTRWNHWGRGIANVETGFGVVFDAGSDSSLPRASGLGYDSRCAN